VRICCAGVKAVRRGCAALGVERAVGRAERARHGTRRGRRQGLTLVHCLAQPEPFVSLKIHPNPPINTPYTLCAPPKYPSKHPLSHKKVLKLSREVDECKSLAGGTRDVAEAAAEAASGEAGLDHGDIPWLRTHPGL